MVTENGYKGILNLWNAVLHQAKKDASWDETPLTNEVLYRERMNAKKAVRWWLGSKDFYKVCKLANVASEKTLKEFRELFKDD